MRIIRKAIYCANLLIEKDIVEWMRSHRKFLVKGPGPIAVLSESKSFGTIFQRVPSPKQREER